MAVKYECPECGRRFLEWGAEKFGYKCPNDEHCPDGHPDDVELNPIMFEQDQPIRRKPTLKRTPTGSKRRQTPAKVKSEAEVLAGDGDVGITEGTDDDIGDADVDAPVTEPDA